MTLGGLLLGHFGLHDARASNGLMRMRDPVEAVVIGYFVGALQLVVVAIAVYLLLSVS